MAQTLYRVGTETKSEGSIIAALPDGGWIAVGIGDDGDGLYTNVYQQRYDKNGNAVWDAKRLVNHTTADYQFEPQIKTLSNGGWVVTWISQGQDGSGLGVYQQVFDKDGNALFSDDQRVHVATAGNQTVPEVTALADGGWVVTWQSDDQDGDGLGVYQQRFDKHGNAAWAEDRLVNITTENSQGSPSVAALKDGGWIVTWHGIDYDDRGFASQGIYQQRFDSNGNPMWAEDRQVNVWEFSYQRSPTVEALADGGWVITWESNGQEDPSDGWGVESGVYQQRFDKDGRPTSTTDVLVNAVIKGKQVNSHIAALPDGGWVVVWTSDHDYTDSDVYQQVFDKNGKPLSGADLLVNTHADEFQTVSGVTVLADGSWIVSWGNGSLLGSAQSVYQQRFMLNQAPSDIQLTRGEVHEAAANGRVVGTIVGVDVNLTSGDKLTYQLLDGAGGRFILDGTTLKVAKGIKLDFEQAKTHSIKVRVTDNDGLTFDKVLEVRVSDVARENVRATSKADKLVGGREKDVFRGLDGNDTIDGGYGRDKLYGGKGKDVFVFKDALSRKFNLDTIADYNVRDDSIRLDNTVFKKLGKMGSETKPRKLKEGFFIVGDEAKDHNDYLIYNDQTGVLSYDKDGSGKAKAIAFAKLPKDLNMKHDEFFII